MKCIMNKKTNQWILMAAVICGLSFCLAACSGDDHEQQPVNNQPVNNKPSDDTPEAIDIDSELNRLLTENNGEEDSVYFFLEEAQKQGNWLSGEYCTCRYSYLSTTADGQPVWLTGRMAWPKNGKASYIVGGCHVTMTDNLGCPSVSTSLTSDCGITCMFFASNALVVFPDYEGYGATMKRAHPYLYQEATARQVIDGIVAARKQFLEQRGGELKNDYKTILVGYSQGGSVAMATQKYLEQGIDGKAPLADDLHLAGSVCGDGPYDPVATLQQYISINRLYMPVVAPLIIKGMCDANPYVAGRYHIDDYLCADFLNSGIADWISNKSVDTDVIQNQLCKYSADHSTGTHKYTVGADDSLFVMYCFARENTGWLNYEERGFQPITAENNQRYTWREGNGDRYATAGAVLRPDVRAYFSTANSLNASSSDAMDAIYQALEMNNLTTGWQPQHPMIVFHSKYDEVVPFVNYERARAAFTSPHFHGITYDTNVQTHVSVGKTFFTLYLSSYVLSIRNGEADKMPREKEITGTW
jgi:pimeloyl-ACP methyl ester carboxylesterase